MSVPFWHSSGRWSKLVQHIYLVGILNHWKCEIYLYSGGLDHYHPYNPIFVHYHDLILRFWIDRCGYDCTLFDYESVRPYGFVIMLKKSKHTKWTHSNGKQRIHEIVPMFLWKLPFQHYIETENQTFSNSHTSIDSNVC